jgi:hypothetical protein
MNVAVYQARYELEVIKCLSRETTWELTSRCKSISMIMLFFARRWSSITEFQLEKDLEHGHVIGLE